MLIDNNFRNVLNVFPDDKALAQLIKIAQSLDLGQVLKGKVVDVLPKDKAVVTIQGQNVTVETDIPLVKGQTVFAKIEQQGTHAVLKLATADENALTQNRIADKNQPWQPAKSTPDVVTRLSQSVQGKTSLPNLQTGQDIQVKIIRVLDDKTLQVEFQGKQFPVQVQDESDLPTMLPGEKIQLRVGGEKNGLTLVAQNPLAETAIPKLVDAATIKPYLVSKQDMGQMVGNLEKNVINHPLLNELKVSPELMGRLRDTVRILSPKEGSTPDAAKLKEQVDRSGTSYEAKVKNILSEPLTSEGRAVLSRDLKGQLLELQDKLESIARRELPQNNPMIADAGKEMKDILQNVKQAADSIELRQLSNQFAKQENNPVLIQIPDPLNTQNGTAKLYFRNDAKGGEAGRDGKKDFSLVFLLDMTTLGSLRIDARLNGNDLSAQIAVENRDVANFIDSQAGELQARLQEIGFNATVSCQAREKVEMQVEEDLHQMLIEDKSRLIDIKT